MARRLTTPGRATRVRGGRRALFAALVAVVAALHLLLTSQIASRMAAAQADAESAMPARIEVAYVRTLEPEAPKIAAAVAAPPATARPKGPASRTPRRVAAAASEVQAEPAPDSVAQAASAPSPEAVARSTSGPGPADSSVAAASEPATALAMADAPEAAASGATSDTFVWPSATRVSYILNGSYRGPVDGRAEVEWIRIGERYQVNVSLFAGPEYAPIFSRRMTSEGSIAESGLVPDRYDEDTQVVFRDPRRVTIAFSPDSVFLANGQTRERIAGVQDTASQFIQFTWLFGSKPELLRVGNTFVFPLALPRSLKSWTYDVANEETLYTPFGALPVFHLKPRLAVRGANELTVEMWFSPELRYLPVRIRIEQDAANFIDLVIAKKPEISAS
jgi:hypothetical protein